MGKNNDWRLTNQMGYLEKNNCCISPARFTGKGGIIVNFAMKQLIPVPKWLIAQPISTTGYVKIVLKIFWRCLSGKFKSKGITSS
jgi:hypothetical protein